MIPSGTFILVAIVAILLAILLSSRVLLATGVTIAPPGVFLLFLPFDILLTSRVIFFQMALLSLLMAVLSFLLASRMSIFSAQKRRRAAPRR